MSLQVSEGGVRDQWYSVWRERDLVMGERPGVSEGVEEGMVKREEGV